MCWIKGLQCGTKLSLYCVFSIFTGGKLSVGCPAVSRQFHCLLWKTIGKNHFLPQHTATSFKRNIIYTYIYYMPVKFSGLYILFYDSLSSLYKCISYMRIYYVCYPVPSGQSRGSFQVESMTPQLQETCLAFLKQNDEALARLNCEEMEAQVTDMVTRVQSLLRPIRVNGSDASLEPPGRAFAEIGGFHYIK